MNEAFRRGTWTCFGCSSISRCPQALTAKQPNPNLKHQRKNSSSKASSSPKNEPRPLATASEPGSSESPNKPPVTKRTSGRRGSRAASKPSAADVHLATFFSRHRPISITSSLPTAVSEAAFSSIFESKQFSKFQPADVIHTVSSAIDNLENAAFQEETTSSETLHPQSRRGRRAYPKAIQRLDNNHDVQQAPLDIEELSKSFHHMIPPPPPQPMGDDPFSKPTVPSRRRDFSPAVEQRTYATTLTITERTLPNGEKTYQASISPIRSVPSRPRLTRRNSASPSSSPSHLSQTTTTTTIKPNEITMIDITPPSSSAPPPPSSRQPFLDRMHKRQQ
ncbi:MAG: hypothetical protein L6R41_006630, partial [Letrouitia leprolyta]